MLGKSIIGAFNDKDFIGLLKKPRRVMLLVQAGPAVDDFIKRLEPLLEDGDIIIDGGNSHFPDSNRRCRELDWNYKVTKAEQEARVKDGGEPSLSKKKILFVGTGVSGGEEGARHGPSLMPGGNEEAWPHIKDIFQSIAAKSDNEPCCDWVGDFGAGHYVKMVHNGIEYGDMQLITEVSLFIHHDIYSANSLHIGLRYSEAWSSPFRLRDR
jgi:6-phosphogluconate dehydrogenase